VRLAERDPGRGERVRRVGRKQQRTGSGFAHLRRELQSRHERGHRRQQQRQHGARAEQRLFVQLQIFVVRERQSFEQRQETGQLAEHAAGVAAGQLQHIGILLVRHARRAGGQRVGQLRVRGLVAREEDEIFREPREVRHQHRCDEQILRRKITIGDTIERVCRRTRKSERMRERLAIDIQRRSRQRARSERTLIAPRLRIAHP
jgi:hypothetical protein